jgi:hypothetical protein
MFCSTVFHTGPLLCVLSQGTPCVVLVGPSFAFVSTMFREVMQGRYLGFAA